MLSVLLLEPHADTRELYREWLQMAGMQVFDVETIEDARPLVPSCDLLVTESQLPGDSDAFAFIADLRSHSETQAIPIIVLSASGSFAQEKATAAGCDRFLAKPCLPEQLHLELFLLAQRGTPGRMARVSTTRSIRELLRRLG